MELTRSETVIKNFYQMITDTERKNLSETKFDRLLLHRFKELEDMLEDTEIESPNGDIIRYSFRTSDPKIYDIEDYCCHTERYELERYSTGKIYDEILKCPESAKKTGSKVLDTIASNCQKINFGMRYIEFGEKVGYIKKQQLVVVDSRLDEIVRKFEFRSKA